ncbi:MAG: 3,4-dihydroxy-2-butanone-4-phosphate synthase [Halobacteriovoraceae bacterium]|jgi:3,4-dihydroxy 2-butanone 4-phosphate synthase / GTP cyclohydrolase II|nr:3,4-dihydroxy-2-butanone-4-phosphate synthase [Halobacteriovoraceae bacterium]
MLSTIPAALTDLKQGKMIIVCDDEDRENEGDLIIPAQFIKACDVNFMLTHARGLICAPISAELARKLELPLMVKQANKIDDTAFTLSIDAASGISTGVSTKDRAHTLSLLANPATRASDFIRPGHSFPLIAKEGGLAQRAGHTEATIELMQLAELQPAGVLCEILTPEGECARLPYLVEFAKKFDLKIISIENLINYMHNS